MITLPIKKKWFDMVLSGEKPDEYREIKLYYSVRFSRQLGYLGAIEIMDKSLRSNQSRSFQVMFRNGYSCDSPSFIAECTLTIGTGKEEWGAEKGIEYYKLHIKRITWKGNLN